MQIISWTIINNEIDFIKDVLEYHASWIDKMYFLDTGSMDGTLEYLLSKQSDQIVVEKYHKSFIPDYSTDWFGMTEPFPEIEVRNYAIERATELFGPSWLVQIDADEIFLTKTKQVIEAHEDALIISASTINPVEELNKHPIEMRNGIKMYDPHARIWKSKQGIKYAQNPAYLGKQYHCIPVYNKKNSHLYHHSNNIFVEDKIHYHIHYMFGKKLELSCNKQGITNRKEMTKNQKINELGIYLPNLFWNQRKKWIEND